MKANSCNLNTRPRPTPASSGSRTKFGFDMAPLVLAESQFQDLSEYMSLAQDFVVREQQAFLKRVDDYIAVKALEGDDKDEYYSFHEDDYDQLNSRFPRIVFSSTLLMACSLFESSLVDLCKGFERAIGLPTPTPWDRRGKHNGIARAAAFLKGNFGIHLSNYSHWAKVKNYFKVRDCIAHADGDLSNMQPTQATQIRDTVELYGSLELGITYGRLVIGHKFVSAVIGDLGGIWPLLGAACFQNAVVGPHYWP